MGGITFAEKRKARKAHLLPALLSRTTERPGGNSEYSRVTLIKLFLVGYAIFKETLKLEDLYLKLLIPMHHGLKHHYLGVS